MLEVLVASVIFTTVMVAMMSVWITHARAIDQSQEQQVAGALAQRIMDMQRARGYQAESSTSQPFEIERTMRGVVTRATFFYTVNVTEVPFVSGPTYKNVLVTVQWQDSVGNHTYRLESNAGW